MVKPKLQTKTTKIDKKMNKELNRLEQLQREQNNFTDNNQDNLNAYKNKNFQNMKNIQANAL